MTFERKLIVGLEEIKAIVFECWECKSKIVLTPEDSGKPPASWACLDLSQIHIIRARIGSEGSGRLCNQTVQQALIDWFVGVGV